MRKTRIPLIACLLGGALVLGCGGTGSSSSTGTSTQSTGGAGGGSGPSSSSSSTTGSGGNGGAGGTATTSTGSGGSISTGSAGGTGGTGTGTGSATTGSGGSGGSTTTSTGSGGADAGPVCMPMSTETCYTGPAGTMGVGACKAGTRTCASDGSGFGPCMGEVVPTAETCATPDDDDCDGMVNEEGAGCACAPGTMMPCYTGPAGTENVGACKGGMAACNTLGTAYGPCVGEVVPAAETCATPDDDDCDGMENEEGEGCVCVPGTMMPCYTGPAGTENVGVCKGGMAECNALGTAYGPCMGQVLPSPETCNTPVDDDCDGQINEEGLGCACVPGSTTSCYTGPAGTANVGACKAGVATCNAQGTAYGACVGQVLPSPETCNTPVDDDCDGVVNEEGTGCVCVPGSNIPCYTGPAGTENVGMCKGGVATCNAQGTAYGACVGEVLPTPETCNTPVDDDCDGLVNEEGAGCVCVPSSTAPCYTGPAGTQGVGVCKGGIATCNAQGTAYGGCVGQVLPSPETCNTPVDDDCDGLVNEEGAGCVCLPGTAQSCYSGPAGTAGVGVCKAGTQTCNAQGTAYGACVGEVLPTPETCNTPVDDDCDGLLNEEGAGCVCVPSSTAPCYTGPAGTQGVGVCKGGIATCNAMGTAYGACAGEVLPSPETCNTPVDDDCDGQVNEEGAGCVCLPGTAQSCYSGPAGTAGVGACKAGTRTCNAQGTGFGACTGEVLPATESCKTAVDDDCDGQVNEGCAALTCGVYQESFDDGNAGEITAGPYLIDWCDTIIPTAQNTPLCMPAGRTLRTNDSTTDPTIWIHKGSASCTQVKITYTYYQFALSNVNVTYQQSNDAAPVCEKTGTFTNLASHVPLQACTQQTVTIPFGNAAGVYVRFEHGTGTNALWIDDLSVELVGCDC